MARRINLDKYGAGIFKRTEMYAAQVSKQFESAVERLLKLTRSVELGEGELFTFSYNNRIGREANAILRDLYANVYQQIKNGATMEWEYANLSADAMIRSIFGKVADDNHFARYFLRNQEAMDAFFERKTAGLNLSQRVWNCTGQLKDEMELALSVAMGKGDSASTISRQVRQYLQEPNKLFRRVRDEEGNLKLSKAAKAYHPGQGVYRSSYKNAMRLTRTETNMAYRSADHERWQRMDFVIGIEIHTSGNHPDEDICDELAGVYPKDFKFVGWHPQCRCFATPLLADEQDMMDWSEKVMRGEAGINDFKAQQITEMPENFTKWLEENADRIENAAHKPYFLTDNEDVINSKELTPQEIAEQRHAMRTPEDEQAIRDAWAARREENRLIDLAANNMLKVAADYGETDVTALEKAMQLGELNAVQRQTKALAQQVLGIKQEEQALISQLPNVHELHKQFAMAEIKSAMLSVDTTMETWLQKYGYSSYDANLTHAKAKLEYEIQQVVDSKKYATWPVAESAYKHQLSLVQTQLEIKELKVAMHEFDHLYSITKSQPFKKAYNALQDAISAGDIGEAKKLVTELENKQKKLQKAHQAYHAKKGGASNAVGNTTLQTAHPTRLHDDDDIIKQVMGMTTVDKAKAIEFIDAVKSFSYEWDYEIRAVQCGVQFTSKYGHDMAEIVKKANDLEEFILKSPKWDGGVTYRGMSLSQKDLDHLLNELNGGQGNMLGAASWSSSQSVSKRFAGYHMYEKSRTFGDDIIHRVVLETDSHLAATSIKHLSEFESELEVLATMRERFRFISMETRSISGHDYIFIKVEPVR